MNKAPSANGIDLVLQHSNINYDIMPPFNGLVGEPPRAISTNYARWHGIEAKEEVTAERVRSMALELGVDVGLAPSGRKLSDFKLIAFDMDSTLITIECLDEIADFCGKKAEVSAITEAAMRGEIKDYAESLRRRVKYLAGLPETVLAEVYEKRLQLTPGAEALIEASRESGLKILLVSGGFTYFTNRLKDQLGLDFVRSNELEIVDGKLTGAVLGEIVDADVKRQTVLDLCTQLGCDPSQAIACGDGSNDLKMMAAVGISIAYKAKPVVQAQASYSINHNGLEAVIRFIEPRRPSVPISHS
jgi:phosphoserine phosphatase